MTIPEKLKSLRNRAGRTMREMAESVGLKGASGWQAYEAPGRLGYLPMEWREAISAKLVGRGDPPIEAPEVAALFGVDGMILSNPVALSVSASAISEAERYVALASPINAAPRDIVRHLFVNILGLAVEGGDGHGG